MDTGTGYKRYFGYELAERLSVKIAAIHPRFPAEVFLADIRRSNITELELLARVNLLAGALRRHLPEHYPEALETLEGIYGQENPDETGMFTSAIGCGRSHPSSPRTASSTTSVPWQRSRS